VAAAHRAREITTAHCRLAICSTTTRTLKLEEPEVWLVDSGGNPPGAMEKYRVGKVLGVGSFGEAV
jgi:hypothetical protein